MRTKTLIVLPIFGAWKYARRCLETVRDCTLPDLYDVAIIVNPCPGEDRELMEELGTDVPGEAYARVASTLPHEEMEVYLMEQSWNKGVAASWNIGIKHGLAAEQDYDSYLFLNSDVIVHDGWLTMMRWVMAHCRGNKEGVRPFCIQPELTEGGNPDRHAIMAKVRYGQHEDVRVAVGINGPCFMITADCVRHVGFFDEGFRFGFYEDTDYLTRIRQAGQQPVIATRSYVHHYHAKSRTRLPHWHEIQLANKRRFERKWAVHLPASLDSKSFPTVSSLQAEYGYLVS